MYAVPTSVGTVLAVCRSPAPDARFASTCQQVAESIGLRSGTLAPGLLPGYALALSAAIDRLNAVRASWGSRLSNASNASVATRAATRLAAAHAQAALALAALTAGPASSANAALVSALRADADAYGAVARAAGRARVGAYRRAAAVVARADRALDAALARLRVLGYRVS
jgi:hypothetical protein